MTPPEIDQLIEEGLTLYGQGDLDGALLAWEKALSVDPDNAQATSYVDYVRSNYDLLTGELPNDESKVPFALEEEPYQIEILPGELEQLQPSQRSIAVDDVDEGWFMDDESGPAGAAEHEAGPGADPTTQTPISFDDQTREYQSANRTSDSARGEFAEVELTPGPVAFSNEPTNLRERDTGFVKPTRQKRPSQVPAEIKMTLRTPGVDDPYSTMSMPPLTNLPTEEAGAQAGSTISLSYDDPNAAADLISSLPTPTPAALGGATDPSAGPRTGTAELPSSLRSPAEGGVGTVPMPAALTRDTTTRDFETQPTNAAMPKPSTTPTREMQAGEVNYGRDLISAPTRDLGLRPLGISITTPASAEDEKTSQRKPLPANAVGEGTRADLILPFDPIDARTAQILDEIDEGAPDRESREDKTRRRITTLFEKALAWSQSGELDKSVASIDLALSEDPNSALGQKLIHRHREQMLQVFQAFLGNLDRQPVLARPLHELANAPISPRAAFLLSRIDGTLTLDELLDVSGMPRIEAYRYLCQLFLRGILR